MKRLSKFIRLPFYYNGHARKILEAFVTNCWNVDISFDTDGTTIIGSNNTIVMFCMDTRGVIDTLRRFARANNEHAKCMLGKDTNIVFQASSWYVEVTMADVKIVCMMLSGDEDLLRRSYTADVINRYRGEPSNPFALATANALLDNLMLENEKFEASKRKIQAEHDDAIWEHRKALDAKLEAELQALKTSHVEAEVKAVKQITQLIETGKLTAC